jgi:hypothetical protein
MQAPGDSRSVRSVLGYSGFLLSTRRHDLPCHSFERRFATCHGVNDRTESGSSGCSPHGEYARWKAKMSITLARVSGSPVGFPVVRSRVGKR